MLSRKPKEACKCACGFWGPPENLGAERGRRRKRRPIKGRGSFRRSPLAVGPERRPRELGALCRGKEGTEAHAPGRGDSAATAHGLTQPGQGRL